MIVVWGLDGYSMKNPQEAKMLAVALHAIQPQPSNYALWDGVVALGKGIVDIPMEAWNALENYNERAFVNAEEYQQNREYEAIVRRAFESKQSEHDWLGDAVVGFFSTIPYMAYAALPYGTGFAVVALAAANDFEKQVVDAGGDVTDPDFFYTKFAVGAAYAAIEKVQVIKPALHLKNKGLAMAYANMYKNIRDFSKVAMNRAGKLTAEVWEEGLQEALTRGYVAYGLDKDMASEAARGLAEGMHASIGPFMPMVAIEGAGRRLTHRHGGLPIDDIADAVSRLNGIIDEAQGRMIDATKVRQWGKEYGTMAMTWANAGGSLANRVAALEKTFGLSRENAVKADAALGEMYKAVKGDANALSDFFAGGKMRSAIELASKILGNAEIIDNEDGTQTLRGTLGADANGKTVSFTFRRGRFTVDPESKAQAPSIISALTKAKLIPAGTTVEDWFNNEKYTPAQRAALVEQGKLHTDGNFLLTAISEDLAGSEEIAIDENIIKAIARAKETKGSDLEGIITIDEDALPQTAFHEAMHGFLKVVEKLSPDLHKALKEAYPAVAANETLNEERLADNMRDYLTGKIKAVEFDKDLLDRIIDTAKSWLGIIDSMKAEELRIKNAKTAQEHLFNQLLTGDFTGIPELDKMEDVKAARERKAEKEQRQRETENNEAKAKEEATPAEQADNKFGGKISDLSDKRIESTAGNMKSDGMLLNSNRSETQGTYTELISDDPDATLSNEKNLDFVWEVVRALNDASLLTADESNISVDGWKRIRNAVLGAIVTSHPHADSIIKTLAEDSTLNIDNILNAIRDEAHHLLKVKASAGKEVYDITPDIADALKDYIDFKHSGISDIDAFLAQQDMFANRPSLTASIMREFFAKKASQQQIADTLREYAKLAMLQDNDTPALFETEVAPRERLWELAVNKATGERYSIEAKASSIPTAEEVAEARRQYDEVVARYTNPDGTKKPGWMKAPNGKPTKLTEAQWVWVRTPNFKKWFGDWEALAIKQEWMEVRNPEEIKNLQPKDITAFQPIKDKAELVNIFKSFGNVKNASDGRIVRFPSKSAGKMIFKKNHASAFKMLFEGSLQAFVENETKYEGHKEHPNIKAYRHYINKFTDGKSTYYIRFTVRDDSNGSFVHGAEISDIEIYNENGATQFGNQTDGKPHSNNGNKPFVDNKLAYYLSTVNPSSVSKVVDENGEPMVVWHGSEADLFNVFTNNKGNWFAEERNYSKLYGKTRPFFLNIKNPLNMGNISNSDTSEAREIIEQRLGLLRGELHEKYFYFGEYLWQLSYDERFVNLAKKQGFDGIMAYEETLDTISKVFNAFSPNQIKSATDNIGTYSQRSDIRWSIAPAEVSARLDAEPTIKVYRAMQIVDGKLYSPMAAKINGVWTDEQGMGKWLQADEHPELITPDGKFKLDKGNGTSVEAAYNPYWHTSNSPFNDQFSSAYLRPNLVVVEVEIPQSELCGKYWAKGAKDPVGPIANWHKGKTTAEIEKATGQKREVILSRWCKINRIVPVNEVADIVTGMVKDAGIVIDSNTITPALRSELTKRGVKINEVHPAAGEVKKAIANAIKNQTIANNISTKEQKVVVDAAMKFFNEFKAKRIPLSTGGEMFFAPSPEALERYGYDAVAAWAEYAIHQVTSDGGRKRTFAREKINQILPQIETIIAEDNVFITKRRGVERFIFQKLLDNKHIARIVATPVMNGLVVDLAEVTSVYMSKGNTTSMPLSRAIEEWKSSRGLYLTSSTTLSKPQPSADVKRYSITAEEDRTYLDAVRRGDIETAQRMVDEAFNASEGYRDAEGVYHYRRYVHAVGYRYGNPPSGGRSYNVRDNAYEEGVSLAGVGNLPSTKSFAVSGMKDASANIVYLEGDVSTQMGGDDEFLMKNVRVISKTEYENALLSDRQKIAEKTLADKKWDLLGLYGADRKSVEKWANASRSIILDPVTYDDAGNVIPLSERFNFEKDNIRWSISTPIERRKDLIAFHNVSANGLKGMDALGGLAMPSFAVTKDSIGGDEFGEISLLVSPDTIDPKRKENEIYTNDAWTPVFPEVKYKLNEKATENVANHISSIMQDLNNKDWAEYSSQWSSDIYPDNIEDMINRSNGDAVQALRALDAFKVAFIIETGRTFALPKKEKTIFRSLRSPFSPQGILVWMDNSVLPELNKRLGDKLLPNGEVVDREDAEKIASDNALQKEIADIVDTSPQRQEALSQGDEPLSKELAETPIRGIDIRALSKALKTFRDEGISTELDITETTEKIKNILQENKADYEAWLNKLTIGLVDKTRYVRNGKDIYTPSGRRRTFNELYEPLTLANAVKAMLKQDRQGNGILGLNPFGVAARQYKTLNEVISDEDRLQKRTREEVKAHKKELTDRLNEIVSEYNATQKSPDRNPYIQYDRAADMMLDSYMRTKGNKAKLKKELNGYGYTASENLIDRFLEVMRDISSMPEDYFEAKAYRAVGFDEIVAAIVPENATTETKDILTKHGIPIYIYKAEDTADRLRALNNAADASNTRFSIGGDSPHGVQRWSVNRLHSNKKIVQYTPKGDYYDRRANARGYGDGLASESVQRAITEIIDGRREASAVRRIGLEIGWEPGREITEIAERNGCLISINDFKSLIASDYRKPDFAGGEHQVWKTKDGNSVIKLNGFFNTLERNEEPIDVFDRYAIHNQLFKNCQYELLGFIEIDRTPYFVVRQPFVANAREATQSEIDKYFEKKGFSSNGGGYWENQDGILASDVVYNNVLVNDKGDVFVIDAVLRDTKAFAHFSINSDDITSADVNSRSSIEANVANARLKSQQILDAVKGTVLGDAINKDFKETSTANLIGQTITSPEDLAALAQIYRNPSFETFRYFFVKNGEVVWQTGVTARLPSNAPVTVPASGRFGEGGTMPEIMRMHDALQPDTVYLLHNHPSGNVKASAPDIKATQVLAQFFVNEGINFGGHIIIDHNVFGMVDAFGNFIERPMSLGSVATYENSRMWHPQLLTAINSPADLAKFAADLQRLCEAPNGNVLTLIGANAKGEVVSIANIPTESFAGDAVEGVLKAFQLETGAADLLIAGDLPINAYAPEIANTLKTAFIGNVIKDFVSIFDTDGLRFETLLAAGLTRQPKANMPNAERVEDGSARYEIEGEASPAEVMGMLEAMQDEGSQTLPTLADVPHPRYQIEAWGNPYSYSKRSLVQAMATADLINGNLQAPERYRELAEKLGVRTKDDIDYVAEAKASYDQLKDTVRALQDKGLTAAQVATETAKLIDRKRFGDIASRIMSQSAKYGVDVGGAAMTAWQKIMKRLAAEAKGLDLAEMQMDTGADLLNTIIELMPEEFGGEPEKASADYDENGENENGYAEGEFVGPPDLQTWEEWQANEADRLSRYNRVIALVKASIEEKQKAIRAREWWS